MIVGTTAYMSPEQARGQLVEKRTDVWAFGCLLYEMLTGRAPFRGQTVSDTVAVVLQRDPDWTALPPDTPVAVRRLIERCLTKDLKRRLRDIGDARLDIDAAIDSPTDSGAKAPGLPAGWSTWRWIAALLVTAGATALVA